MRNKKLIGTGVALITPFNEDFTIDFNSLGVLIDYLIENKINYFVVMGTTAESATLSIEEQNKVLKYIKEKTNNRVPIVFGIGGNDTNSILNRIYSLDFHGIEAILSVCPYYNKPSQKGLLEHYSKISEASPVDIILYNVPSRTALNIDIDTVVALVERCSNIIGIKEASGDHQRSKELLDKCAQNISVFSGDDKTSMEDLILGFQGNISVTANIAPLQMHQMCMHAINGETEKAKIINNKLDILHDNLFIESNPIPVKWALHRMGFIKKGIRLPLTWLDKKLEKILEDSLIKTDIITKK